MGVGVVKEPWASRERGALCTNSTGPGPAQRETDRAAETVSVEAGA